MASKRYEALTRAELIEDAQRRRLDVESTARKSHHGPLKRDYVRALHEDDQLHVIPDTPFQFMDLTPELRAGVYKALFVPADGSRARLEILRASRAIYTEAIGALYREKHFVISLDSAGLVIGGARIGDYWIADDWIGDDWTDSPTYPRDTSYLRWPLFLRKCRQLVLRVELENIMPFPERWEHIPGYLNVALYSLCSFLQHKHSLVSFEIDLSENHRKRTIGWRGPHRQPKPQADVLSPLRLLHKLPKLTIPDPRGRVKPLSFSHKAYEGSFRLKGNAWQGLETILQEARAYDEILANRQYYHQERGSSVKPGELHLGYKHKPPADIAEMQNLQMWRAWTAGNFPAITEDTLLRRAEMVFQGHVIVDEEEEQRLPSNLHALRGLLDRLDIEEMKETTKEWGMGLNGERWYASRLSGMAMFLRRRQVRKATLAGFPLDD